MGLCARAALLLALACISVPVYVHAQPRRPGINEGPPQPDSTGPPAPVDPPAPPDPPTAPDPPSGNPPEPFQPPPPAEPDPPPSPDAPPTRPPPVRQPSPPSAPPTPDAPPPIGSPPSPDVPPTPDTNPPQPSSPAVPVASPPPRVDRRPPSPEAPLFPTEFPPEPDVPAMPGLSDLLSPPVPSFPQPFAPPAQPTAPPAPPIISSSAFGVPGSSSIQELNAQLARGPVSFNSVLLLDVSKEPVRVTGSRRLVGLSGQPNTQLQAGQPAASIADVAVKAANITATGWLYDSTRDQLELDYASVYGRSMTVVDCNSAPGSTAMIIRPAGQGQTTVEISNFMFKGCQAGAIRVEPGTEGVDLTIRNCIFSNNININTGGAPASSGFGGAIHMFSTTANSASKVEIIDSVFLDNAATRGSALYAGNRTTVVLLRSVFHANGQASSGGLKLGSAVELFRSCLSQVAGCTFVANGANSSAHHEPAVLQGGAMRVVEVDAIEQAGAEAVCNMNMTDNVFLRNAAQQRGGAVCLVGLSDDLGMTRNVFMDNVVGSLAQVVDTERVGGGLYLDDASTVRFQDNLWQRNRASRAGGAVWSSRVEDLLVVGDRFISNSAGEAEGGAMYASKDGVATWVRAEFRANTAAFGGAVSCSKDIDCNFNDTSFFSNSATSLGGAIECLLCQQAKITRSEFRLNHAASGGAVALNPARQAQVFSSSFTENFAAQNAGTDTLVQCTRDSRGSGGAICVGGTQDLGVVLSNNTFIDNAATNGGAIMSDQQCPHVIIPGRQTNTPEQLPACKILLIDANSSASFSTFVRNKALGGGGGIAWFADVGQASIACRNRDVPNTQRCSYWVMTGPDANTASYGPLLASSATYLDVQPPVIPSYLSSSTVASWLNAEVRVKDAYDNFITDGSSETWPQFFVEIMSGDSLQSIPPGGRSRTLLTGNSIIPGSGGAGKFAALSMRAPQGTYQLRIGQNGLARKFVSAVLNVTVRNCHNGEVMNAEENECNPCQGNTFSFNPRNKSCDVCPSQALCAYPSKVNESLGSILVPRLGYWHSSPFSSQLHACINPAACAGPDAPDHLDDAEQIRPRLLTFQKTLAGMSIDPAHVPQELLDEYGRLQCGQGYEGNLCGVCQEGYGRGISAECVQCPSKALNVFYYGVTMVVHCIMVAVTVSTQLQAFDYEDDESVAAGAESWLASQEDIDAASAQSDTPQGLGRLGLGRPRKLKVDPSMAREGSLPLIDERAPSIDAPAPGASVPAAASQGVAVIHVPQSASRSASSVEYGSAGSKRSGSHQMSKPSMDSRFSASKRVQSKIRRALVKTDGLSRMLSTHSSVIKILVNFLQIASILRGISVNWPGQVRKLLDITSHVSATVSSFVSIDCLMSLKSSPRSIQTLILTLLVPVIIIVAAIPVWITIWSVWQQDMGASTKQHFRKLSNLRHYLTNRMTITVLSVIFYFYPSITTQLLMIFSCPKLDVEDGPYNTNAVAVGRWWTNDYNLQCYTGQHALLMGFIAIPGTMLFSIGVPVGMALFLWRNKSELADESFSSKYAFFYVDYDEHHFYYESIVLARKFVLVVLVVFGLDLPEATQLLLALGVIIGALVVAMLLTPYKLHRLNVLDGLSHWGNVIMVYLAMYFFMGETSQSALISIAFAIVIITCLLIAYFLLQMLREFLWTYMRELDFDNDGLYSYADVQEGLSQKRGKLTVMLTLSISRVLDYIALQKGLYRRLLSRLIMFPCEHLSNELLGPMSPTPFTPSSIQG